MGLYEDMVAEENRLEAERALKARAGAPSTALDQQTALEDLFITRDKYSPGVRGLGERYGDAVLTIGGVLNKAGEIGAIPSKLGLLAAEAAKQPTAEFFGGLSGAPETPKPEPKPTSRPVLPKSLTEAAKPAPVSSAPAEKSQPEPPKPMNSGGLRAYRTPEGKVYFSNNIPTEDATEISYKDEASKTREKINPGAGPGDFSVIQGTDEMIRNRAARDAMMKNMAAEMSMTPEEKFNRQLDQSKRLAQVQSGVATQGTINEYTKLAELMGGARVLPDENPDSSFNRRKAELYTKFKGTPEGAKKPDAEVWKDAWEAAKQEFDQQFAQQVWGVFLTRNRATSAPILPGDEATGG